MTGSAIRLAALAMAAAAACHPPPAAPPVPPAPVTAIAPYKPSAEVAIAEPGSFLVAGCNVECAGCTALDSATYVVGSVDGGGAPLFAGPPSAGAAYSCSAAVRFGEQITLRATGSADFVFDRWRLFSPQSTGDYCPCAGSHHPVCRFTVVPELAGRYQRAYCGAVWRPRDGVQVATEQPAAPGCRADDPRRFMTADGALHLSGSETLTLGPGPHRFTRICVRERARLNVCSRAVMEITGDATSVIAGRGIGPTGADRADIIVAAAGKPILAILFDNLTAPIKATFEAPGAPEVYVALTGKTGLELAGGPLQKVIHNGGWGDTSNFPACGGAPASIAR